jgi:hypothetical protein
MEEQSQTGPVNNDYDDRTKPIIQGTQDGTKIVSVRDQL